MPIVDGEPDWEAEDPAGASAYRCGAVETVLSPGDAWLFPSQVEITGVSGTGTVQVGGAANDPEPGNDTAAITLTVGSARPGTGDDGDDDAGDRLRRGRPGRVTFRRMQGTVAHFDPATRAGEVLLDDGSRLAFDAAAFDASGLRLLRPGQRVRLDLDGGRVTHVSLITMRP